MKKPKSLPMIWWDYVYDKGKQEIVIECYYNGEYLELKRMEVPENDYHDKEQREARELIKDINEGRVTIKQLINNRK